MARKKDPVGQIVTFFQTAPLAEATMLHKVISGLVSARLANPPQPTLESLKAAPVVKRRGRGPNKPKAAPMTVAAGVLNQE